MVPVGTTGRDPRVQRIGANEALGMPMARCTAVKAHSAVWGKMYGVNLL